MTEVLLLLKLNGWIQGLRTREQEDGVSSQYLIKVCIKF